MSSNLTKSHLTQSNVVLLKCPDYDKDRVFEKVHEALIHLGGIERFVKAGQKVLLKPNMLSAKAPKRGITTHPLILEAMVKEVQSAGGEVWIGDSPSGALKGVKRCWENTGFLDVAERTGAKLINFEAGGTVVRKVGSEVFHLAKSIFDVDVVINLPKMKTHGYTLYTGAIKNLYGTLPGLQKAKFHKMNSHPKNFSSILVDIFTQVPCAFHLMDGILGMAGNGPATGDLRNIGLILASEDGVALDCVASHLMGFDEGEIDAIRIAGERGLGAAELDKITILGDEVNSVHLDDFPLPSNRLVKFIPEFLVRWLSRFIWVKPEADLEKCTGCELCARSCPVEAITMVDNNPVMDYHQCINCLCCNECCPEGAVIQRLSWLAKKLG